MAPGAATKRVPGRPKPQMLSRESFCTLSAWPGVRVREGQKVPLPRRLGDHILKQRDDSAARRPHGEGHLLSYGSELRGIGVRSKKRELELGDDCGEAGDVGG